MDTLRTRFGAVRLAKRDPFAVLSRSIISQQISTKAANTIRTRIERQLGSNSSRIATSDLRTLRSFGLSGRKATCLRQVARLALQGELAALRALPDHEIKARLTTVTGIGPWTVNMFLIFCLARQDIWPISDAGLRSAARRLYGAQDDRSLQGLGDRFRPFRSIAAIYLWKSLQNAGAR